MEKKAKKRKMRGISMGKRLKHKKMGEVWKQWMKEENVRKKYGKKYEKTK